MTVEAARHAAAFPAFPGALGHRIWTSSVVMFARKKPLGAAGAAVLIALVLVALFADLIAPYDPVVQDVPKRLREPGAAYWFGTDIYGRDVFSRIVFGSRVSLYVGMLSVCI